MEAASKLLPDEIALATVNSQFLQKHSSSARAVLASAQVLHILGQLVEEIESNVFSLFNPDVDLDIDVSQPHASLLALADFRFFADCIKSSPGFNGRTVEESRRIQTGMRQEVRIIDDIQGRNGGCRSQEGCIRPTNRTT